MLVPPDLSTFDSTVRRPENLSDALPLMQNTPTVTGYWGAGDELRVPRSMSYLMKMSRAPPGGKALTI